jgi:hypothetical protein
LIKAIEKTEWVTVLYVNVPGITGGIYPGKPRGLLGAARLLLKRWAFAAERSRGKDKGNRNEAKRAHIACGAAQHSRRSS